jgi:Fic family protein
VHNYADALRQAVEVVKEQGLLTTNTILQVQQGIEENNAGFRQQSGTTLKNEQTGEVIYTPPQHPDEIVALMTNLEQFMNDDTLCDWDALVKMAVIHHQFESIHPFYDGNGRTGRIINVLYLVKSGLLSIPILYLSRYINQNKSEYYRLLQTVRDAEAGSVADSIIDNEEYTQAWQAWVLFMLEGVEQTANDGVALIHEIKSQMLSYKHLFRAKLHKIYSQDLLNNIFRHPYTKIDFVMADLAVSRITATKYLDALVKNDLLVKIKLGRDNYYINVPLYDLLANVNKKSP